jgi:hypothetical protein
LATRGWSGWKLWQLAASAAEKIPAGIFRAPKFSPAEFAALENFAYQKFSARARASAKFQRKFFSRGKICDDFFTP